jgi:hypothetical protein
MPADGIRFLPIIYVRGYAMTEQEQDETTADPFCGFNVGSTVFSSHARQNQACEEIHF